MDITIWNIMTDVGIMSVLLMVGILLKAKVSWIQKTFMPASFIAGLLGLLFGPNGLGWLPFSSWIELYPAVLIAVVFASIPIGAVKKRFKEQSSRIRNVWVYGVFILMLFYAVGLLVTQLFLTPIMNVPVGAGMMLGVGFFGGHGSAAAIGETFASLGWEEATSLGYTSATIGMVIAVFCGMLIIKRGTNQNEAHFVSDFKRLPNELKTGLMPKEKRQSIGETTLSPNAVDPLLAHIGLIAIAILLAYGAKIGIEAVFPMLSLPLFSFAILTGILIQWLLRKTKSNDYVDKRVVDRIGGTATDLIVMFGIASINLTVVASYAIPLAILFIVGLLVAYISFRILAPRTFRTYWFENAVFSWGYTTGTVAMGVALLKIVDPELKSTALEDFGVAYLGIMPFEVLTLTFLPLIIMSGFGWVYTIVAIAICLSLIIISRTQGWITSMKYSNDHSRTHSR